MLSINKFLPLLLLTLALWFSYGENTYALDNQDPHASTSYLSQQLEQLVKTNAPDERGLHYFVLPDSHNLTEIPQDPQNPLTLEKVKLGQFLFHETALSINPSNPKHWQQASCASCHFAQAGFRSNLPLALGTGGIGVNKSRKLDPEVSYTNVDKQKILAPSILNVAFQDVMLWDGRAGSHGLNAKEQFVNNTYINRYGLSGLETVGIDGITVHKMGTAAIADIPEYQQLFAQAFPDRPFVSAEVEDNKRAGLAIAAYERTLLANQAPFQKWLKGDRKAMSASELRGGITFFKSSCVKCHAGPNLANMEFHAVGFSDHPSEINGLNLGRSSVTRKAKDDFKFKVPQLYNLSDSSPHGHGASFQTLREVVEYFNHGEPQNLASKYSGNLSIWLKPLNLNDEEIRDLTAFLETGLRDPNLERYVPERIPSGLCFPNNDPVSRKALNCE
ncbi:MAG: cytochrome C peroxidase [Leptolyngbyaceae cyanobacterium RM2_2_4]|nr:cytochrome C peroxidase [Leptolyngbyaceae cyanobacterium RM2_2_4]